MWEQSESVQNIAKAIVSAQKEMEPLIKNAENPFFKSKYADLKACYQACASTLSDAGIAVVQGAGGADNGGVVIYSSFIHSDSGEWMRSSLTLYPKKDKDPQAVGSAITYGRRYLLCAMAGLAPEDDDGNYSSGKHNEESENPVTKDQIQDLVCQLAETGSDEKAFLKYLGAKSFDSLTSAQYEKGLIAIKAKKATK